MKRTITIVAALGLTLAACGGDDEASPDPAVADVTSSVASSTVASAETESASTTEVEQSADDLSGAASTDGATPDASPGADDASGGDMIQSLDDIPEVCRDEMATFLQDIEPIVSTVEWENATIAEFESISDDFTAESNRFEAASAAAECDELAFGDGEEFDLLVEFAEAEAPGTVGFFRFLELMRDAAPGGGGSADAGATTLATCADGIAFVEELLAEYESIRDVPAAQLATFQQLPTVLVMCDETQAEFFDREDVDAFLSE